LNKEFTEYFKLKGIRHQLIIPYSLEDGIAEMTNRTIVEKARSMMQDAGYRL